jgi:hypothetical protein
VTVQLAWQVLARRASLVAALLLLASAITASAERAWVLWLKTDYDAALDGEWIVSQALATRQGCIAALEEMFKETMEKFRETGKATGNAAIARAAETMERAAAARGSLLVVGRGQSTLAKCLPDTLDPHGAKGK